MCVCEGFFQAFRVAEPEKQVTQTKAQEMAYCETTNQTFTTGMKPVELICPCMRTGAVTL